MSLLNPSSYERLTALIVEVDVRALLVVITGDFRFFVPLKPGHILLVKSPGLLL